MKGQININQWSPFGTHSITGPHLWNKNWLLCARQATMHTVSFAYIKSRRTDFLLQAIWTVFILYIQPTLSRSRITFFFTTASCSTITIFSVHHIVQLYLKSSLRQERQFVLFKEPLTRIQECWVCNTFRQVFHSFFYIFWGFCTCNGFMEDYIKSL